MLDTQKIRLQDYLEKLRQEALAMNEVEFTVAVVDIAEQMWERLNREVVITPGKHLTIPNTCPGSNDNIMYTWFQKGHYLECEVFGDGNVEFFYRNFKDKQVWGEDTTFDKDFSIDIVDKILYFVQ